MSDSHFETPDDPQIPAGRSGDIEVICALGFFVALFVIPQAFANIWRQGASWHSLLGAFFSVAFTVCLIGLWKMRRWAVFIYTGIWIVSQLVLLLSGHWTIITVPVPVLVMVVGYRNLWRMT